MRKFIISVVAVMLTLPVAADEGLWLFNQFPTHLVKERYGFDVTPEFLDHLRLASVRFNNGGSGSFVSPDGLLFTNHHVGADCIHKLSSKGSDYMADGFYARTLEEEKACPDLEVNILLRIEDVTNKVNGAEKPSMSTAEANQARKGAMSELEKECSGRTGNRCDVVTLYSGGLYHLYEYRKYTDVRLVFAPEYDIAAFGGDPDNFTYPRYCLDFAFFRAYENGKPVRPDHYLKWNQSGLRESELVFVSGHPGTTGRMATAAELQFYRDASYPVVLERMGELIDRLLKYGAKSPEHKRQAQDDLHTFQNSFKAYTGFLRGLRDPNLMDRRQTEEAKLRALVAAKPELSSKYAGIWDEIAAAYEEYATFYLRFWLLERSPAWGSDLFPIARTIFRMGDELARPNEQRLREFAEAGLDSLKQQLFSPAPISNELEIVELTEYFRYLAKTLGKGDPIVRSVLQGRSAEAAARYYVKGSRLADVELRKSLAADAGAVKASKDTMLELARILDGPSRDYRKRYEDKIEAVLLNSAGRIAQVKFAATGTDDYPDATFTLRLSFAAVKGYKNGAGKDVPYTTRFAGVFERATGKEPFRLPKSWLAAQARLRQDAPFNFVSTADSHGGNSGSPTVNTRGEVVGILFDGNLEGLPNRFVYSDEQARSVHVSAEGIVEALAGVYGADRLLGELGIKAKKATD